jgi:hypothetical protein
LAAEASISGRCGAFVEANGAGYDEFDFNLLLSLLPDVPPIRHARRALQPGQPQPVNELVVVLSAEFQPAALTSY